MPTYTLTLTNHYTPWSVPTLPEVLTALRLLYPDDTGLTVIIDKDPSRSIYNITMSLDTAEVVFLSLKVQGKEHAFPLLKQKEGWRPFSRLNHHHAEGTLYTMHNCTQGPFADISNDVIDHQIAHLGTLTRPTEHQKHRGTSIFNGNRFFCMVPSGRMPDKLQITDPLDPEKSYMVTLGYKGKDYFCSRCQERHVGACAYKTDFYKEKDFRKTQTIKTTIIADSTLRHAEVTGLSADIICMAGGRVGNVSHVLMDAPEIKEQQQIVIVAGVNDINRDNETESQFLSTVTKGVDQIQQHLFGRETALTILAPILPKDSFPLRKAKLNKMHHYLDDLSKISDPPFQYIRSIESIPFDGIHPTVEGTEKLLKEIHEYTPIIRNGKFISNDRMYKGVQSIFKYGCLYCPKYLDLDLNSLCPACQPPHQAYPTPGEMQLPPADITMTELETTIPNSHDSPQNTPSKKFKRDDGSTD